MESEGGEDLSWWWRGWYFNNWNLDLALSGLAYVDGDPAKGARVTVETRDRLVMPSVLQVRYADGREARLRLPVETWIQGAQTVVTLPGAGAISTVTVDPDHQLPDRDRSNNTVRPAR